MTGFEPATSGSTIRRSNQLSYTHHAEKKLDTGSVAEGILTKREEDPQLTVVRSASCIEGSLHFGENCSGGDGRIRSISDGSADHQVIGPRRNRLGRRGRPGMSIDMFAGGTHAGCDN